VFVEGGAGGDGYIGESAVAIVVVENAGRAVAGDENIGPAIVVVIQRGDAQGIVAVGFIDVGLCTDVLERAVTAVVIQNISCCGEPLRAAHHRDAFPDARGTLTGRGSGREIKVDVIGDHQVEMAVAIVVN